MTSKHLEIRWKLEIKCERASRQYGRIHCRKAQGTLFFSFVPDLIVRDAFLKAHVKEPPPKFVATSSIVLTAGWVIPFSFAWSVLCVLFWRLARAENKMVPLKFRFC